MKKVEPVVYRDFEVYLNQEPANSRFGYLSEVIKNNLNLIEANNRIII
ncbi:hypothetical protein [Clostridium sp. CCUG 7971]|nr:hypothetical protein [Clostridium sp. CCUG 7971]MBO3444737.1 hypothetical protein [Clostridium sp. CCUG 7971]